MFRNEDDVLISPDALSDLLFDLYRSSRAMSMQNFRAHALNLVRSHIPFDSAWWAMATVLESGRECVHDSFTVGLPGDSAEHLNRAVPDTLIARTCRESPGVCINFRPQQLLGDSRQAAVTQHLGSMNVLCTVVQGSIPQLISFLSLERRDRNMPFTEDERRIKQLLTKHLMDMAQVNWITEVASTRAQDAASGLAMAVTDEVGMLHAAEPGLDRYLKSEWPDWRPPFLPQPVLAALAEDKERYLGTRLSVRFRRAAGCTLISVARRSPGDALSPREWNVAEAFANGDSYKEVARRLGLAPSTVRFYLRTAYEKLGISGKAELAKLLFERTSHDEAS